MTRNRSAKSLASAARRDAYRRAAGSNRADAVTAATLKPGPARYSRRTRAASPLQRDSIGRASDWSRPAELSYREKVTTHQPRWDQTVRSQDT